MYFLLAKYFENIVAKNTKLKDELVLCDISSVMLSS